MSENQANWLISDQGFETNWFPFSQNQEYMFYESACIRQGNLQLYRVTTQFNRFSYNTWTSLSAVPRKAVKFIHSLLYNTIVI